MMCFRCCCGEKKESKSLNPSEKEPLRPNMKQAEIDELIEDELKVMAKASRNDKNKETLQTKPNEETITLTKEDEDLIEEELLAMSKTELELANREQQGSVVQSDTG